MHVWCVVLRLHSLPPLWQLRTWLPPFTPCGLSICRSGPQGKPMHKWGSHGSPGAGPLAAASAPWGRELQYLSLKGPDKRSHSHWHKRCSWHLKVSFVIPLVFLFFEGRLHFLAVICSWVVCLLHMRVLHRSLQASRRPCVCTAPPDGDSSTCLRASLWKSDEPTQSACSCSETTPALTWPTSGPARATDKTPRL